MPMTMLAREMQIVGTPSAASHESSSTPRRTQSAWHLASVTWSKPSMTGSDKF